MTRAMLLSAGLGTRLGPLGVARPKPLLPVCDMPILSYGISNLVAHGITEIVINLHHRGEMIRSELGDGSRFGATLHYVEEESILGTGGGLKNALDLLDPGGTDEPFVSMNGKLIFDVDITEVLATHLDHGDVLGTMVVRPVPDAEDWGALTVSEKAGRHEVVDFFAEGRHMFCGVHVTRPSVMRRLPDGEACSIRQGYLPWMKAGEHIGAYVVSSDRYFAEHSNSERYLESNIALLGATTLRNPPGPLRGIDPRAHIDATARLKQPVRIAAGAHICADAVVGPNVVVGAHAIIEAGCEIHDSVVWPKARAHGTLSRAIATPNEIVPV